jgi:hypothetical protein
MEHYCIRRAAIERASSIFLDLFRLWIIPLAVIPVVIVAAYRRTVSSITPVDGNSRVSPLSLSLFAR